MALTKITYQGILLDADVSVIHSGHPNALTAETTVVIPKNNTSVQYFMGWPKSQGVHFESELFENGDYFLVEETPSHYIFMNR
ncbi:hypothetical protein AAGR22_06630 [Erwinia sp. HDF1-3R]|uniref:hypothetical protein n=1 Tax=Erwinia sp. HDF1-3R TaxID=3141543 RepID=UPI0031F4A422